jgi:hypothetical protein
MSEVWVAFKRTVSVSECGFAPFVCVLAEQCSVILHLNHTLNSAENETEQTIVIFGEKG